MIVREEFLRFVELSDMYVKSVASAINNFVEKVGLDPEKCIGQGYDECSTMAGKDGGVQNILRKTEAELWYSQWKGKNVQHAELKEIELAALVKETQLFYPSVKRAPLISLALPCTTCSIERSFSTLRRVKTWLRSTKMENRLVGLCMMSAHKKRVLEAKNKFEKEILLRFSQKSRRLMLK
ncbi:hypothetical protein J437_LFUL014329 [Ladona fulva]|uniref:HAT C-terminal dimerisation domain-containing protein n=1 Tax=Ladona fulva TaxID=123851 RepID=A0A8K0P6B5_LADFU|nr:hypothetical protein J437_LFUL014329 [Ladona fulva]